MLNDLHVLSGSTQKAVARHEDLAVM